jgi:hypothetical protein
VATGQYSSFKEVAEPRSSDFLEYGKESGFISYDPAVNRYTVDPDGSGAASSFSFSGPDFNYRSLRGNAVLRWEFRPGSALYLVWNDQREDEVTSGQFHPRRDLGDTIEAPGRDIFLIKVSYWLPI